MSSLPSARLALPGAVVVAVSVVMLTSCASNPLTVQQIAERQSVSVDTYLQAKNEVGLSWRVDFSTKCNLRRWSSLKGAESQIFLDVTFRATEWLFLKQAFDSSGEELRVIVDDHEVSGGLVREVLRIPLSPEYLGKRAQDGLNIKLVGKRGTVLVRMPGSYVEGFLLGLDSGR